MNATKVAHRLKEVREEMDGLSHYMECVAIACTHVYADGTSATEGPLADTGHATDFYRCKACGKVQP